MKTGFIYLIAISVLLVSCSEKQRNQKEDTIPKSDDSLSPVKIIKFKQSRAIIFPADYAKKIYTHPEKVKGVFTPDEKTVNYIEENLKSNFHLLLTPFQTKNPDFSIRKENVDWYDKQFSGYINSKKDSVIVCTMFNFKSDPYTMKQRIEKEILGCVDGWCDANTFQFFFNKTSKKFEHSYE